MKKEKRATHHLFYHVRAKWFELRTTHCTEQSALPESRAGAERNYRSWDVFHKPFVVTIRLQEPEMIFFSVITSHTVDSHITCGEKLHHTSLHPNTTPKIAWRERQRLPAFRASLYSFDSVRDSFELRSCLTIKGKNNNTGRD